ncbi:MAG: hypothetical protein RL497_81 [Pseudomonadota bacterium]|jgi:hypothetical protein
MKKHLLLLVLMLAPNSSFSLETEGERNTRILAVKLVIYQTIFLNEFCGMHAPKNNLDYTKITQHVKSIADKDALLENNSEVKEILEKYRSSYHEIYLKPVREKKQSESFCKEYYRNMIAMSDAQMQQVQEIGLKKYRAANQKN